MAFTNVVGNAVVDEPFTNKAVYPFAKFWPLIVRNVQDPTGTEFWLSDVMTGSEAGKTASAYEGAMELFQASTMAMENVYEPAVLGVPARFVFACTLGPGW